MALLGRRLAAQYDVERLIARRPKRGRPALRSPPTRVESIRLEPELRSELLQPGQETFVSLPELGGDTLISDAEQPPGSVYTIGTDPADGRLAMFLLQCQMNRGSGRIVPLGNLSTRMREALKAADAYLKANLRNLGIDADLRAYDLTIQAVNLNQAKEGADTAVAFFISMVSALLGRSVAERSVVLGEMTVQGTLVKVSCRSACSSRSNRARGAF